MTVTPVEPATPPGLTATLRLSPNDMKDAGKKALVAILVLCVITGVVSVDDARAVLQVLLP